MIRMHALYPTVVTYILLSHRLSHLLEFSTLTLILSLCRGMYSTRKPAN